MSIKLMKSTVSLLVWALPAAAAFAANLGPNHHQLHAGGMFAFALAAEQCVEIGDRCDASSDCCG